MSRTKKLTVHNQCYGCVHRRTIPGDCHTRCAYPWAKGDNIPQGHRQGRQNGWWLFPENFDPVWHLDMCEKREEAS